MSTNPMQDLSRREGCGRVHSSIMRTSRKVELSSLCGIFLRLGSFLQALRCNKMPYLVNFSFFNLFKLFNSSIVSH